MRQYAKRRGVSPEAVSLAVRRGRIQTIDGKIDPVAADAALAANTDLRKPRNSVTGHPGGKGNGNHLVGSSFLEAQIAKERAQALLAELTYEERIEALVPKEQVSRASFSAARRARDLLLTIPDRLSPVVAGLADQALCHRAIREEVDRVCSEISDAPLASKKASRRRR